MRYKYMRCPAAWIRVPPRPTNIHIILISVFVKYAKIKHSEWLRCFPKLFKEILGTDQFVTNVSSYNTVNPLSEIKHDSVENQKEDQRDPPTGARVNAFEMGVSQTQKGDEIVYRSTGELVILALVFLSSRKCSSFWPYLTQQCLKPNILVHCFCRKTFTMSPLDASFSYQSKKFQGFS